MTQPSFDTLKYATLLIEHDFTKRHVQGLMSAQILVLQSTLEKIVTHDDMRRSEYALRSDLQQSENALRLEIKEVEHRLKSDINEVGQRLNTKINDVEQRLDAKITDVERKLDAKITETSYELKSFVLKNTLAMVITMLSLNIGIAALVL